MKTLVSASFFAAVWLLSASPAFAIPALDLTCRSFAVSNAEPLPGALRFSEATGIFGRLLDESSELEASDQVSVLAEGARLVRSGPRSLDLTDPNGVLLAKAEVSGHPLNAKVELAFGDQLYSCEVSHMPRIFEYLVDDSSGALAAWKSWMEGRPAACDAAVDSEAFFHPDSNGKVALVLHGYSSDPHSMNALAGTLLDSGYTVFLPRLSRHYTTEPRDLDQSSYQEWVDDAERALAIARRLAPQVTVVGYSLGGLLSARLAIKHPSDIDRMIVLAPAWRLSQAVNAGSNIGSLFGLGLNDIQSLPPTCKIGGGYVSPQGGVQIQNLIEDTERRFRFKHPNGKIPSAFTVGVPHLILTAKLDKVINPNVVTTICRGNGVCWQAELPDRGHLDITRSLDSAVHGIDSGSRYSGLTVRETITRYLALKPRR